MAPIARRKETLLDALKEGTSTAEYASAIWRVLCHCFPEDDLFSDFTDPKIREFFINRFEEALPYFRYSVSREEGSITLAILSQKRFESGRFIHDMYSRWLLPGKRVEIELFFTANFTLFDRSYTAFEIVVEPKNFSDLDLLKDHLMLLEREVHLGLLSIYHARKILEIKGFAADEKTALVQEKISAMISRHSQHLDYDLFSRMQHFLVTCRASFKESRNYLQMCRVIVIQYLFRKSLERAAEKQPQERHLAVKCRFSELHLPLGIKSVVSVFIGLNFIKDHEILERTHIEKALQNHDGSLKIVEDSFLEEASRDPQIQLYYFELEKVGSENLSLEELKKLKKALQMSLEMHIECLVHPLFMPRNEEEILKNAVMMSRQLKYSKDIPQIMISFDEQTEQEICFTVILARVLLQLSSSFEEVFHREKFPYEIAIDRVKTVGAIRKKYAKEVAIFRIKMPTEPFLRDNHSLDLYHARQCIFSRLEEILGPMRDFNGGMLGKQMEVFKRLRKCLGNEEGSLFLLENFFHGIYPVEMKTVVPLEKLLRFFRAFQDILRQTRSSDPGRMHFYNDSSHLIYFNVAKNDSLKRELSLKIKGLNLPRFYVVKVRLHLFGLYYTGGMIFEEDLEKRKALIQHLTFDG